jgi:ligand-binding sensor domain-containing protein/serine phosphatase RsbU (regulator of sigma subunit)
MKLLLLNLIAPSIFLTLIFSSLHSQPINQNIQFDQITNESGRSLGFITGIEQDSTGFLWFASRNGLSRYDGYSFAYFRHSKRSTYSLSFNDITFSYYDRQKTFWLRHFDRLYLFENQRLSNKYDTILRNKFSHNTEVVQDIENNYWIGPHNQHVYRFNPRTLDVDTFLCQTNLIHPEIIKTLEKETSRTIKLQANPVRTNLDTAVSFSVNADGYYIVATAGEGNRFKFFDFGNIKKNSQTLWAPQYEKCNTDNTTSLFYCQIDMVFLAKGNYTLTYKSDNANTFDINTLDSFKRSLYGITLVPVANHREMGKLFNKPHIPELGIYGSVVYQLSVNQKGYPLISSDKAIQEYNPETIHFEVIETTDVPQGIRNNIVIPILETKRNEFVYAIRDKVFLKEGNNCRHIEIPSVDLIICLMADHANNLWIGTTNGLFVVDISDENPQKNIVQIKSTTVNRLFSDKIWQIFEDHSHNVWIGTDKGLNRYKRSKFNIIDLGNERFASQPIITDPEGTISLLTRQGKWTTIKGKQLESNPIQNSLFTYEPLTKEYLYDFNDMFLTNDNAIIFTVDNKVGKMDKSGKILQLHKITDLEIGTANIATRMLPAGDYFWVATIDNMILFDNNINLIRQVSHPKTIENTYEINKNFIKDIVHFGESAIAVRTEMDIYTVSTVDFTTQAVYEIPEFYLGTSSATGNLSVAGDSNLWFVVFPQLVSADKNGVLYETTLDISDDIGNSQIAIHGSSLIIFSNNGLIKIDNFETLKRQKTEKVTEEKYEFYTTREGLADNLITGIVPDRTGNLWLTTLKGLSYIDFKTGEIQNHFRDGDFINLGFPGNRIHRNDRNKDIAILQTTNGLLIFRPDSVNPFIPNVVINEILLFGKELETDSLIWDKKHLKLKYNQNFLTISFSSLDFTQPVQNKYRYRLINFNNEWTYTDANNRKAPFTGLPPGEYKFIVQGTNNDGVWNEKGQQLIIHITPPWWKTTLAYILYVIFTIAGIVAFVKIRERKLVEEKRVLEAKVKARTHEIMMQKEEILKQRDKIADQNKNITDSIHYASRIQAALLPSEEYLKNVLPSYFILWRPRDIVSGDFFWITHENNITISVAADCTGHGVPGAFMSMLGIAFLNDLVNKDKIFDTDHILNELRSNIMRALKQTGQEGGSKDGMDISMCAINHKALTASFSGAYNPLIIIRDGEYIEFKGDKMPIGYHIKKDNLFTRHDIELSLGDRLYMYSDGYVDQFGGADGRKFMSKNFKSLLVETRNLSMSEQKIHLNQTIEKWMGKREQIDDILVFGIEITNQFIEDEIVNKI